MSSSMSSMSSSTSSMSSSTSSMSSANTVPSSLRRGPIDLYGFTDDDGSPVASSVEAVIIKNIQVTAAVLSPLPSPFPPDNSLRLEVNRYLFLSKILDEEFHNKSESESSPHPERDLKLIKLPPHLVSPSKPGKG